MSDVSILLVGRSRLVLDDLRGVLRGTAFQVVGEASCAGELAGLDGEVPDLVIIELGDGGSEGAAALRRVREALPGTAVVVLADSRDSLTLAACLSAGAAAFLLKDVPDDVLLCSLKLAMLGQTVMPTALAARLVDGAAGARQAEPGSLDSHDLSRREVDILRCLATGGSNKAIARRLGITEATVKVHVKRLLHKIAMENRTQAAIWALSRGFIPMGQPASDAESPCADGLPAGALATTA